MVGCIPDVMRMEAEDLQDHTRRRDLVRRD